MICLTARAFSGGGHEDAGDELDGGALTGAVGPEEAHDLALVQGQGDLVQHLGAIVAEDDLLELYDGFRQSGECSGGAIVAWRASRACKAGNKTRYGSGVVLTACLSRAMPASTSSDRKSTRLNSSHLVTSYSVFCLR